VLAGTPLRLRNWTVTQPDWRRLDSFHAHVNDGSFISDGTITSPTMKSYVEPVSSRPHLSSANERLDYSVTLPDSLMMSQQTKSFGPAAKLNMVSDHHPTGNRRFRLHHCRLTLRLRGTPANIRINRTLPETTVIELHFCR